jgi:hypothetical protein
MSRKPKGRPAPALVLCRACVEYVFAGTRICPHCGQDARKIGARYRDGGYAAVEAIRQIDDLLASRAECGADGRPNK